MRESAVEHQSGRAGREATGRSHAIGGTPPPSLSLPSFAHGSLPIYAGNDYMRKMAGLGTALVKAGVEFEWEPDAHIDRAVTQALGRWIDAQWEGLRCINLTCRLVGSVFEAVDEPVAQLLDHVDSAELVSIFETDAHVNALQDHVALVFDGAGREEFLVGPGVEELESLLPGIGWEALRSATAITAFYDVFDLAWTEFATEQTYWWGMDSEKAWCEESGEDLTDYEGITRAQLDEFAPVKRMRESKRLTRADLRRAAKHPNDKVARIARMLVKLRGLGEPTGAFSTDKLTDLCDWRDPIDATVLLGWQDFDGVFRVGDDYSQQLLESGETMRPFIGLEGVQLGEEASLKGLAARWTTPIKQLRLADALLWELGGQVAVSQEEGASSSEALA